MIKIGSGYQVCTRGGSGGQVYKTIRTSGHLDLRESKNKKGDRGYFISGLRLE